ncbi:MAG: hypothetical protein JSV74_01310 [Dehalococcoidia bacterium]|nr:MAG: hypothetical protein JSV74_01310 [Dehalococcoidia bacterium]
MQMKHLIKQFTKRWFLSIFIIITFTIILGGCNSKNSVVPESMNIGEIPIETNVKQLIDEYMSNEKTADIKYKGKKLVFYGVVAEHVESYFPHGQYHEDPMPSNIKGPEDYEFMANSIIFKPRDPIYLYGVVPGSIVDVVGICQGLSDDTVIITDSWIKIVSGETGIVDY